MQRPLDVLEKSIEKRVLVTLKDMCEISGKLMAFDSHINIWLEDAELSPALPKEKLENRKLGRVLVRGDNIVLVSPQK